MFFNEAIETLPLQQLRALQNKRLLQTITHARLHSPFYKKQWLHAGIDLPSIQSVDDLHRLPFTTKEDLRDHYPFGMFAVPMDAIARIHCSSGTTGKPTVVGYTKNDLDIFSEVNARSLVAAGARPGMKLQNAYGYGLFTGGLGLHYGAEKLGMAVIPVSGGMTERQIMLLLDFKPEVMCCTPSYALALAEVIVKKNIDVRELNLKYMLLGAEPWTETVRQQIEQTLQVAATNIYGLSEIIGPGVAQEDVDERHSGSYIWEDHFFPEVVHPVTGEPVKEGDLGVLVFTTLTKEAMPLVRYRTNDITNLWYEKRSKRTHIKMGPIQGRADDMLIIRGVNLFPTQVEAVLQEIEGFSPHYQLVVTRQHALDEVEVLVELDNERYPPHYFENMEEEQLSELHEALQHQLSQKIKGIIGLTMKVTIKHHHSLPRSEGGKLGRIIDLRNN